jgi:hypothetical protein
MATGLGRGGDGTCSHNGVPSDEVLEGGFEADLDDGASAGSLASVVAQPKKGATKSKQAQQEALMRRL